MAGAAVLTWKYSAVESFDHFRTLIGFPHGDLRFTTPRLSGYDEVCDLLQASIKRMKTANADRKVTMPAKKTPQTEHIEFHKNGSIGAKGPMANGVPAG